VSRGDKAPPGAYRPPVDDLLLALEVVGLGELLRLERFAHVERDVVEAALAEFGRLAAEVLAPLDAPGDRAGATFDAATGQVRTPAGFAAAYARYVEAGWGALQFPRSVGGGGFPAVVALALQEIFAAANLSLSLAPVLTQGAIELLLAWGSEEQRRTYLPHLLTGEWTGTMELTEAEAGSDLAPVRTEARRGADGTWRVTGTKIFITWGEHDLAENIVHLVLARTPGAPPGTRGLSVFLVPKLLPTPAGLGGRNAVACQGVERKLGLHASPTCVMRYEGAAAELVGALQGGMRTMFTMMNAARLSIGLEGPAIGERAYQQALGYARTRLQGRVPGLRPPQRSAIVEHADVRRMLLLMRTGVQAARLLVLYAASRRDLAHQADAPAAAAARSELDLLTPIAKAWASDLGVAIASLAVQVFGGAGYLEETGVAQRLRDARIVPIYEGTNGIQAIDLVTRKLPGEGGAAMRRLLGAVGATATRLEARGGILGVSGRALAAAGAALEAATDWLLARGRGEDALAGATAYLELAGLTLGGWLMARRALVATGDQATLAEAECHFYAVEYLSRAPGLLQPVTAGATRLSRLAGEREG